MEKTPRFLATAVVAYVIYLLLARPLGTAELVLGGAVALLAAALVAPGLPFGPEVFHPRRLIGAAVYLPVFLWKMVVANLQIAAIVVRPRLRIRPSIVQGRTECRSNEGLLLLTSSITLTPGTLSVDADADQVFVHWVVAGGTDTATTEREILKPFEKHVRRITE